MEKGKFGRAALTIALCATAVSVIAIAAGLSLMMTGYVNKSLNYLIGMLIIFSGLFQLVAIPVGVIGLFENSSSKRPAWIAIILSGIFFVTTFSIVIIGKHSDGH